MRQPAVKRTASGFLARPRALAALSCLGLLLAPALGYLSGLNLAAQGPGGQLPPRSYMNKSVFYLPIHIDERARANLREIQLYVKDNPTMPWRPADKAQPSASVFPFRPPQDGEYWFTVVTVDRAGRQMPPDVSREAPGVIVVQDSQKPQIVVRPLPPAADGQHVQCEVQDANPDPSRTRVEYQTADQVWRAADPVPGRPNTFCIPQQAMHTGMVKALAADRAGNVSEQVINISHVAMSPHVGGPPRPLPNSLPGGPVAPAPSPGVLPPTGQGPAQGVVRAGGLDSGHGVVTTAAQLPAVGGDRPIDNQPRRVPSPPDMPVPGNAGEANVGSSRPQPDHFGQPRPPRGVGSNVPVTRKVVNHKHVTLEYQLEAVGASGVGKVEVYVTGDQGQSWQKLCEDTDHRSPVEIDLPGEGVYGVSLVVSNGRGFGGQPPAPGDTPDWWIEVDSTPPVAELYSPRPGAGQDAAALLITWNARDKNLTAEPVDLFYAVNREGPWTSIARGVKNDGRYRWVVPQEIGKLVFVQMVVTDKAGNTYKCHTAQAVALDDGSRPRAHVIDAAPPTSKLPPSGN